MSRTAILAGAILLLSVSCVSYDPPPAVVDGSSFTHTKTPEADSQLAGITELSLPMAQKIALENNPTYLAAGNSIRAAQMRYYQALGTYLPTVNATASWGETNTWPHEQKTASSKMDRSNNIYVNTAFQGSWLLFDGFSRYFSQRIAKGEVNYYTEIEADDARLLARSVAYAYNTIMLSKANMRIASEDRDFQNENLKISRAKFAAGAVPRSDVLNFEIYVNTAESDYISAKYNYELAIYALAALMGYPEGTLPSNITFSPIPDKFDEVIPAVEVYLDMALANRPDLKAMREQMQIYKYLLYRTYSAYSPSVYAYGSWSYGINRYSAFNVTESTSFGSVHHDSVYTKSASESLDYGLQAQMTLFNGFARYNAYREAKYNLAVSHYQIAQTWLTVVNEVRNSHTNYLQSAKQAKLYEQILSLTTMQRDLVQEEYNVGNIEITRLNEVQRDLVNAQTNLVSSYVTLQNAKAQLDAAVANITADDYKNLVDNSKTLSPMPITVNLRVAADNDNAEEVVATEPAN